MSFATARQTNDFDLFSTFKHSSSIMKKSHYLILIILLVLNCSFALPAQPQRKTTPQEYIETYKNDAVKDMMLTGVPASITLAQGILESESGNSTLAREANNHFGIKCHNDWRGERIYKDDDAKDECFRKYPDVIASYNDHSRFLRERSRYAFLFDYKTSDYKAWARGLKKAGYATNPKYADHLIRIIEQHHLHQYDRGGKKVPLSKSPEYPVATNLQKPNTTPKQLSESLQYETNANGIPYVVAEKGDTYFSVANEHDMMFWQILKYNEAGKDDLLHEGEVVYLKPKRGKPASEYHVLTPGQSMREVSQIYGIKLRKLYKLNKIEAGVMPEPGTRLRLK